MTTTNTTAAKSPEVSMTPRSSYLSTAAPPSPVVAVHLVVKRARLLVVALVAIGTVATALLVFRNGVALAVVRRAAATTVANEQEQSKLLDKYNAYTGNAAAALTKPIEVFASMALQLVLLRFAARTMLDPTSTWRIDKFASLAAWVLLYSLLNGFNSLNVQMQQRELFPIIQASDLSVVANGTSSISSSGALAVTTATVVVPEATPGNPVTNTILRTAVTSREWFKPQLQCEAGVLARVPDDGIEFGFPIRAHLPKLLPTAPLHRTLSISLTDTTTTVDATKLPMTAARAATVFRAGVAQAHALLDWFLDGNFNVTPAAFESVKPQIDQGKDAVVDAARAYGVLPFPATGSEASDREWLVREAPRLLKLKFNESKDGQSSSRFTASNETEAGLSMAFSHVDITPTIAFDAVTIDAAVNLQKYTTTTAADGTRYKTWNSPMFTCRPGTPSLCMVPKELYGDATEAAYDFPSQIQAGALCANTNGADAQQARVYYVINSNGTVSNSLVCDGLARNGMLVASVGKRIVVDSILESPTEKTKAANASLEFPVLVNARKVYSITVGKLYWQTEDLAEVFGAQCDVEAPTKCRGLRVPLEDGTTGNNGTDVLVASVDAIPTNTLTQIGDWRLANTYTPLVLLREPTRSGARQVVNQPLYRPTAGDMLMPHNILKGPARNTSTTVCSSDAEVRLHSVLTNHLYMEDGLQSAYTSALFWVMQNGVVKPVVNASRHGPQTLSFDGNQHDVAYVASIPEASMWFSLAGCIVLALCVLGTMASSRQVLDDVARTDENEARGDGAELTKRPAVQVSDPRVIAEVMLNEARFPPLFLDRKIVDTTGQVGLAKMDSFQISSMTLEGQDHDGSKTVVTTNHSSAGDP